MPPDRRQRACTLAIFVLAGLLRLPGLDAVPAPINPDEASNGYDAWCLGEAGADRWGDRWPVLLEAFGRCDWRPALYAYLTIPAVALLGPEQMTVAARLPAAVCGLLTVVLFHALVRRASDRRTAAWATALLAVSPWHVMLSRFGHESALTPFFPIAALLLLDKSGGILSGDPVPGAEPRPLRWHWPWALAAGVVIGLAPYAYASMKVFLPVFLLAVAAICGLRGRRKADVGPVRGRTAALLLGTAAALLVLAPMLYLTITQWDRVNARAADVSVFHQGRTWGGALLVFLRQYASHFGWNWLFVQGDPFPLQSIPRVGQVNWYMLVLLPLGLYSLLRRCRAERWAGVLLAWLLLHPLASALAENAPHALRAAPGIGALEWVAAVGLMSLLSAAQRLGARESRGVAVVVGLLLAINATWALTQYFVTAPRHPYVRALAQTDLRDAMLAIRGLWGDYDRVFISDHCSSAEAWPAFQPYIYVLCYLPVPPARFQGWDKRFATTDAVDRFHILERMGPFVLSTRPEVLAEQFTTRPQERVLIVARPGDVGGGRLLAVVRDVAGRVRFELIAVDFPAPGANGRAGDPEGG